MCTDLRLVRLSDLHISGRTMDFAQELGSQVQVVPAGKEWAGTETGSAVEALTWTNAHGYVAMDAFGFDWAASDGLNDAGLSIGTLWLPETDLPTTPPASGAAPAIDLIHFGSWILGTCATVQDVRDAFAGVQVWNAPVKLLWPAGRPMPDMVKPLLDFAFPMHLAVHDAHGGDLVVEFLGGAPVFHDNPAGVLTNSPTFDWHTTNLRNYVNLTSIEAKPMDLMGLEVDPTGNGSGLLGLPGDVTPPSRFVRAAVLTAVSDSAADARAAVNQVFHALDLVHVPRKLAASGDYTQWYVARDHDNLVYYVRSYDSWVTDAHDLRALRVSDATTAQRALPLPVA
ncbi:MAG TPA: linear amide C-N hydrolase [Thermoleophilia bacterium]|nr:linear amide C-N hydrolase [Thermoleophilia bacterium]